MDLPLFRLSPQDIFSLEHATMGTQILGGSGSGKSSTSARLLAESFLINGFGGIVLCAKPEERAIWIERARKCGRLDSVVVFDDSRKHRFNFMDYEANREGRLTTHNLVTMFMRVMEGAKPRENTGSNETFWRDASESLMRYSIAVLYSAYGRVTLNDMMRLIMDAPSTPKEAAADDFLNKSFCYQSILKMTSDPVNPLPIEDLKAVRRFFQREWPNKGDRLQGSVVATLTAAVDPLLTGYLRELFCTTTTVVPEMTHEGAIIIVDLPIKTHDQAGIFAQHVWKYLWQRATERRAKEQNISDRTRPVFIFADENQFFVSKYDNEFQSTARSAKACSVYVTQNLDTYYTVMDGRQPKHTAGAFLGNLQNKIFHQNLSATTNNYAADTVGRIWQDVVSRSVNTNISDQRNIGGSSQWGGSHSSPSNSPSTSGSSWGGGRNWGRSKGESYGESLSVNRQVEHEVLPSEFSRLKRSGKLSAVSEAIVVLGGQPFAHGGKTWLRVNFSR